MQSFETLIKIIYFANVLMAIYTVFRKPRNITTTLAWLLTLTLLPVIGFLIYAFCGRGVDHETMYRFNHEEKKRVNEIADLVELSNQSDVEIPKELSASARSLVRYFGNLEESPLSRRNQIKLFTDGHEKFENLFIDLRHAENHIHVEYYSFFNDKIGNDFLRILEAKALEGVEVCLIYDPWGSPKANKQFFAKLVANGGRVTPFITSKNIVMKTRLNYHLHRKIVVIDGKIGWTGGFNVGDQYLGRNPKFGYWRDTHARVVGSATFSLQEIFIRDWNTSVKHNSDRLTYEERYFLLCSNDQLRDLNLQVVADGPELEADILKGGFIRMIMSAKERVWIQTPYLIPDDSMLDVLLNAARSGIDVRIMTPDMPDHPFIYRATQFYSNYLHKRGVKIYRYNNGFLHAKTLLIDDTISTMGSTNQDIRSYSLNFESNIFIYDQEVTEEMAEIFLKDQLNCTELTDRIIKDQSLWLTFKQNFSRLLSPIL